MASLRAAMDAAFWGLNLSTPQTLDGTARSVPDEPVPLDGARASRVLRIQQVSILRNGFPLGIIPSFCPTSHKELGSLALQSLFFKAAIADWWVALIGQFRPKKLISAIKAEVYPGDEWELPAFKDVAKHFLDKSLYSLGACFQLPLTPNSSILLSTEKHGEKGKRRHKAMLFHKLPEHDITFEAAWPELFLDNKGRYWDVPESMSLDCSSLVSDSGLRYRFGIHKNSGLPHAFDSSDGEAPLNLMPGLYAKAAFSYEKSKDLWRQKEMKKDVIIETGRGRFWRPAYDIQLKEPHAAISGIIGGTCLAWLSGRKTVESREDRRPFGADLFGSFCLTLQHGKFRKAFVDLTRIDARLDISSASALAKHISSNFRNASRQDADNPSLPRLALIFQQQVAGPIVFRVDSKFSLAATSGKQGPQLEDLIYSLNYSLRLLSSGKVVAWYSPKRKEGMIELRVFDF